jgi:hypothetical protein
MCCQFASQLVSPQSFDSLSEHTKIYIQQPRGCAVKLKIHSWRPQPLLLVVLSKYPGKFISRENRFYHVRLFPFQEMRSSFCGENGSQQKNCHISCKNRARHNSKQNPSGASFFYFSNFPQPR